ncbi:hypothetical protein Vadar_000158 [Vaccinium darrowii]|uniref:Uncharacterized protein n=1 Tax=Vaccinium darrowii TaxID=229202 RepID=A0ACB7Z279_9ERIC|nr:hypothetical protein Vadar_000158 [Vaccinium darrowii]
MENLSTLKIDSRVTQRQKMYQYNEIFDIGVTCVTVGEANDQVEVTGEGVDSVKLASSIRKKVSCEAIIVRVEDVIPPHPETDDHQLQNQQVSIPLPQWDSNEHHYAHPYLPAFYYTTYDCEAFYDPNPLTCSIL